MSNSKATLATLKISDGPLILDIKSFSVFLPEVSPLFKIISEPVQGNVSGSFSKYGKSTNAQLSFKNVGIGSNNKYIENLTAELSIKSNQIFAQNISATILGYNAELSIATTGDINSGAIVNINFDELDIPTIITRIGGSKGNSTTNPKINSIPYTLRGILSAKKVRYDNINLSNVSVTYSMMPGLLVLPKFTFQYYESQVLGSSTIDIFHANPVCSVELNVNDFKMQHLADFSKELNGRLFGVAKAKATLSFNPLSQKPIDTLQGKCSFSISNGKLANTGIQNKLGVFLDPLKFKLKDLEFNTINGAILFQGSVIQLQTFVFNSPDIRLIVEGSVTQRDYIDSSITLEFNNVFIQDLPNPALLTLDKYKKGKWFTVNFSTKGKISDDNYSISIK
jgi:hypothetical protein